MALAAGGLHLGGSHVLLVGGDGPAMAEGIGQAAIAVAPEHVLRRHDGCRTGSDGALVDRVAVLDIEMDGDRRAADLERPALAAHLGKLVVQHQGGIADAQHGMHQPLAVGRRHPPELRCAEGLLVEFDRLGRAGHRQVRRQTVEPVGDLLDHRLILLGGCVAQPPVFFSILKDAAPRTGPLVPSCTMMAQASYSSDSGVRLRAISSA